MNSAMKTSGYVWTKQSLLLKGVDVTANTTLRSVASLAVFVETSLAKG